MRAALTVLVTLLSACGDDDGVRCPAGSRAEGSRCVAGTDGGPDASHDAGPDAGPCGTECPSATPLCRESDGTCVACLGHPDCTHPDAPACVDGACVGCTGDTDCGWRTDTPVCDEPTGRCGACTVDTEEERCPAPDNLACHPTDLTCTGAERGSLGFCQACVSDSECLTDAMGTLRCVPMTFGTPAMPHGTYCLRDLESYRTATSMPAAPCPDRMVVDRTGRSVFDVEAEYCFVRENLTTCEAVLGFDAPCPGGAAECGAAGLEDAVCQSGTCTYECGSPRDCITGTCGGGGPTYCQ